jgi:hypothetical protein
MDLILIDVLLLHSKLVQLTSNMIGSPCVQVPSCINILPRIISIVHHLVFTGKVSIKMFPAPQHRMTGFLAQLTDWLSP